MLRSAGTTWSPGFLPGDLKSHRAPDRCLSDHLAGTARLAQSLKEKHQLAVDDTLLRIVCETHDLEKAYLLWQNYLNGRGAGVVHAFPSSCFTLDATQNLWAAEVVRRHHTCIENARSACQFWIKKDEDLAKIRHHMQEVVPSWTHHLSEDEWEAFIDGLWEPPISCDTWLTLRTLYSLLVTADRMDAIGISELEFAPLPNFTAPDFARKGETPLDGWRRQVHDDCMEKAADIESPGLYTLTLPTGAGKTVVGLKIARLLADRLNYETIVYALPFISIIEQNASVAKTVFGSDCVQEDHSQAYSDLTDDDRTKVNSWARMSSLFRYWRTPVVLTTMVQLWDSIFDPRANASMDFHRLSRAVVILDEPQGIAPGLWHGFGKTLSFLSEKWGTTFILMTATQPHIGEGREIAPSDLVFPYNRHTYRVLPEKHSIDKLLDLIYQYLPVNKGSGLVVLNTKKSALEAYALLKKQLQGPVLFLSAWMTPRHRRSVMRYLKYLERKGIRHYLVATQVVEAGVDLDFDWVFRDMGPLDSVIQVAGRCNRHLKNKTPGTVLIAELVGDKGQSFSSYVYDDVLLENSRNILISTANFDENRVPELISTYYENILQGIIYKPIWSNIENGLWGQKEELIKKEDDRQNETVFVEMDCRIRPILEQLQNTKWTLKNLDEKKRLLMQAQQYSIEVSLKNLSAWRDMLAARTTDDKIAIVDRYGEDDCWFITKSGVGTTYDRVTGFVPADLYGPSDLHDPFI